MTPEQRRIVELSRELGEPSRQLVIQGEGNTSVRIDADRMLVKASGASLARAEADDFLEVAVSPMIDLVEDPASDDRRVAEVFARVAGDSAQRPSVESMLHAVCLEVGGATVVAHTHPVRVNALLCSDWAEALATHVLFPEQVVILGPHPVYVPYHDPGLELARAVRDGLQQHLDRYGEAPRIVYLGNHGIFALGDSDAEVLRITEMAVKCSEILTGAILLGGPRTLPPQAVARLHTRPDEIHRRDRWAGQPTGG